MFSLILPLPAILVTACGLTLHSWQDVMGAPRSEPAADHSPSAAPNESEQLRSRERKAEPLYQKALAVAGDSSADPSGVLAAIEAALAAGACPTRTLTEGAFLRLHTLPRFRELIRDHTQQSTISMRLPDQSGEALRVSGVVLGPGETPVAGALIYVYHTDAKGLYSPGGSDEANPQLFGYMRSDALGRFEFKTIRPGHYPDQTEPVEQHIHGEVTAPGYQSRIVRIGFADDPFWVAQGRQLPRWAVPVTRDQDGSASCRVEVRLEPSG